ncbi:Uncharacterized protein (Fragment) OS=uncultured bacterium PE=4 SV=1 [Gemmataceae bacterium]
MTEDEWLTCLDVRTLTKFLPQPLSRRKATLAVCGYGYRVEGFVPSPWVIDYLTQAEREADGSTLPEISFEEASRRVRLLDSEFAANSAPKAICYALLWSVYTTSGSRPFIGPANYQALRAAVAQFRNPDPRFSFNPKEHSPDWVAAYEDEEVCQAAIVRDIFGNPFRPVAVDPAWLTADVVALARGIYEERAFDRMPILADALQDAGCDNDDVLTHCRDASATHVRGCWVVDLVLGKE